MTAKRPSSKNEALPDDGPRPVGDMPLEDMSQDALRAQLKKVVENEPVVRDGHDPEGVHDMRVAIRTLRAVLRVFEDAPVFDQHELRSVRRRLRGLARALGRVRDGDVLLHHLEAYITANPASAEGLSVVREQLADQRATDRTSLLHELDRTRTRKTLKRLKRLAADTTAPAHGGHLVLVRHFLGSAIWRRYEAVLAYERVMPGAPTPVLHQLRIACKRLRYTVELLEDALPDDTAPVVSTLRQIQDHLGALQDQVHALETLAPLEHADATNEALAEYVRARAAERDQLQATFAPLWQRVSGYPFRQALAACLARL